MKLVSFNINGLRARLHQLEAIVKNHQPDVIGLQETKVHDEQFPLEAVQSFGYHVEFHGQKGHYGVALLTKQLPETVIKGFPTDSAEAQKRWIGVSLTQANGRQLHVFNGYFPQGESRDHPVKFPYKECFYADLQRFLPTYLTAEQDVAVMGDFNIGPEAEDIGIGEQNEKRWLRTGKCCFLPEEREWFARLMSLGLKDTYRKFYPQDRKYSWFDYRSRGFEDDPKRGLRIDFILSNPAFWDRCQAAGIDHEIRSMDKPSDHCPVWVELSS